MKGRENNDDNCQTVFQNDRDRNFDDIRTLFETGALPASNTKNIRWIFAQNAKPSTTGSNKI